MPVLFFNFSFARIYKVFILKKKVYFQYSNQAKIPKTTKIIWNKVNSQKNQNGAVNVSN